MDLSQDHQRRLDAVIASLAESARIELAGLIRDVAAESVQARYGSLETPEAQETARVLTYVRAERVVAASFADALAARILNPHVPAWSPHMVV